MHTAAIIVIGNQFSSAAVGEGTENLRNEESARVPIVCLEVLGRSVLELTIARLRQAGIQAISVIAASDWAPYRFNDDLKINVAGSSSNCWRKVAQRLKEDASQGIGDVIVMELNAYVECNFGDALQFHRCRENFLTQFEQGQPLNFWIVSAAAMGASTKSCVLPFSVDGTVGSATPYPVNGYVNRLKGACDLRRLVVDAFLGRCAIRPRGREIRPGVWIDERAKVDRSARIVAPVYIGRRVKLRRSSVITRFTNIERNCRIGAGTMVESASVLAYTEVGKGLDVSQAVVQGSELVDLTTNLVLKIDDPTLFRSTAPQPRRAPKPAEQHETSARLEEYAELERSLQGEV